MNFHKHLIQLVKERKCLYQTKSRSDTNNQERRDEWQQVSAALRKPVGECRLKWRSLRDRFVRERKKLESDDAPNNEQKWEYYDDLTFLVPAIRPRKRKYNKRSKIYVNPELSNNFGNVSNSRDEGSLAESFEGNSFDGVYEFETSTLQECKNEIIIDDTDEEFIADDDVNLGEQQNVHQENEPAHFFNTKDEEWTEDYEKYPTNKVSNSPKSIENQNNYFESVDATQSKVKENDTAPTTAAPDPAGLFVELINMLKSEINKSLTDEKDENDFFMECMALKMKKLSSRAKLKIQSKLLYNINEELANEMQE